MTSTIEAKFDSMMDKALFFEPVANPGRYPEIHGALFEHPSTNPFLNMFARPGFQDDRVDPLAME